MTIFSAVMAALLFFTVTTLWVQQIWPWALFQVGIFLLTAIRVLQPTAIAFRPVYLPLAGAAMWPVLQLAFGQTVSPGETWTGALNWITFFLVFLLTCDTFADEKAHNWFLKTVCIGTSLLAVLSVAQKYSGGGRIFWLFPSGYSNDVLGPFVNRNQYSAWIELLLPVALYFAMTDQRARAVYGVCAAAMLSSVIAGGSRLGSALVIGEILAVMGLVVARREGNRGTRMLWLAQVIAASAAAVAIAGSGDLLGRLNGLSMDPLRLDALRASMKMIAGRPWVGAGIGTWPVMYPKYASMDTGMFMNQAHNDWAQWAAEGGLPFAFLLLVLAGCLMKPAFRTIYGLGVVAFLLHALFDYPMQQRPGLAAWFFAIAGAIAATNGRNVPRALKSAGRPDPLQTAYLSHRRR